MQALQAIACAYWSWSALALQRPLWQVDLEDLVGCSVPYSVLPGTVESVVGQCWLPLNPPLVLSPSGSDRRSMEPAISPGLKSHQTWCAISRAPSSSLASGWTYISLKPPHLTTHSRNSSTGLMVPASRTLPWLTDSYLRKSLGHDLDACCPRLAGE